MPIDALPDDLDALRALVSCLSSERDAAIEECRRVREQNDRLHHLLRQLQRAQFGRRSERLDHEQMQLALEDIETTIAEQDAQEDKKDTAETTADAQRKKRCANRGSLPEVLGGAGVLANPDHPADIARAIAQVLHEDGVAASCTDAGIRRARAFRWDETAHRVYDTYRHAIERRGQAARRG